MLIRVICVAVAFIFASCSTSTNNPYGVVDPPTAKNAPGSFAIGLVKGLSKSAATLDTGVADIDYDLGAVHASMSFYFLLQNNGESPIKDINVSFPEFYTKDSSVYVTDTTIGSQISATPKSISVLQPKLLSSALKVNVIHGVSLNGVGWAKIMSPGDHKVKMVISGKTTTYIGTDTTVSVSCNLYFKVYVMDITIHSTLREVDLTKPIGTTGFGIFFDGFDANPRAYLDDKTPDSLFAFVNTGNVPVNIKTRYLQSSGYQIVDTTLGVGDSVQIQMHLKSTEVLVRVGANNTVTNYSKLPLNQDGNAYLLFYPPGF